eukprot:6182020-Pleurochrysis_carterae.AAC.1
MYAPYLNAHQREYHCVANSEDSQIRQVSSFGKVLDQNDLHERTISTQHIARKQKIEHKGVGARLHARKKVNIRACVRACVRACARASARARLLRREPAQEKTFKQIQTSACVTVSRQS